MPPFNLKDHIRSIPNFPKPGIMFRDITPLLNSPPAFRETIKQFADYYRAHKVTKIMAAEARGFIFATPLALELDAGFIPVRKPGKLPFDRKSHSYELEYGKDTLEIHTDALTPEDNVLMVDDLLATGGTMRACVSLAEHSGAKVAGCAFLIELDFLNGRQHFQGYDVHSLIHYDDENP